MASSVCHDKTLPPQPLPFRMISWLLVRHNRARLWRWSAIFGSLAAVQLVVQLLNAVSGFLLVRTLEKPDYAWFTIASGMSAALSILSDSGVGSAVTSIGGKVWQDKASLKGLVYAALRLRRKLAALASLVLAGISLWLLLRNGAGLASALGLTALVLAPIWQISTTSVLNVVNRLHSRTRQLQAADLLPAVVRVALTAALVACGWISPLTALFAVLVAHLAQYLMVRQQVLPLLGADVEPVDVEAHAKSIRTFVHQLLPNCIFICIQGQITTWLISIFATTSEVADFGALSRLGIIFAVLGGPVGQFVAPAFARATGKKRLWAVALAVMGGNLAFSGALLLAAWLRGEWFLWLLGGKYAHLRQELVLVLAGMSLTGLSGMVWALNTARGWIRLSWLNIPLTMLVQMTAVFMLPLNTVVGLAWFVIASAIAQCLHAVVTCLWGLTQRPRNN